MSALESMKSTGKKKCLCLCWTMIYFISVAVKRSSSRSHLEKRGLIWFTIPGCSPLWMAKSMQGLKASHPVKSSERINASSPAPNTRTQSRVHQGRCSHSHSAWLFLPQLAPGLVPTDMSADQPDLDNSSIDSHLRWFVMGPVNN